MDLGVSTSLALYVGALAMLAAASAGILPAIQATGSLMQSGVRTLGIGGGMRLGKTWSVVVVAQVALAVLMLPLAAEFGGDCCGRTSSAPGLRRRNNNRKSSALAPAP